LRPSSGARKAFRAFLRNDAGSELMEFALVLSLFSVVALLELQRISQTANYQVGNNQNAFSTSLVNGP
jgi:Flp pilus assembly pilin Flp